MKAVSVQLVPFFIVNIISYIHEGHLISFNGDGDFSRIGFHCKVEAVQEKPHNKGDPVPESRAALSVISSGNLDDPSLGFIMKYIR